MAAERGPVVVDTDVYSARLIPDSALARQYEPLLVGRPEFVSFQTVAEVRYGALLRGLGDTRLRRIEAALGRIEIVYSGPDLIRTYAELSVPAGAPATRSAIVNTMPTGGSPPQPSDSRSRSSRTTAS